MLARVVSLSGAGFLILAATAIAQTAAGENFSLSPAKQEIVLSAGQTAVSSLTLTNNLGRTAVFRLQIEDIIPAETPTEIIRLGGEGGPYSLKRYLIMPASAIELSAGQAVNLPLEIRLPPETPPGSRHGAVVVIAEPQGTSNAAVAAALSALIFVQVEGEAQEDGRLVDFGPIGGWWQAGEPAVRFHVSFHNQGNVYLNPYGGIDLRPLLAWGGRQTVAIEPNFVLPVSTRLREAVWRPGSSCGLYAARLNLNRGYRREVNIIDRLDRRLFVCPPALLSIFFLLVLGLGLGLMIKLKSWIKSRFY